MVTFNGGWGWGQVILHTTLSLKQCGTITFFFFFFEKQTHTHTMEKENGF